MAHDSTSALAATHEAAALVLDSPYSSAVDVAAVHYRMLPVRWLMFDQFRSDLAIRDVHIPVLIVHGDDDRVIPMNLAKRLFERANEPKEIISVAGGGHLVLGLTEVFVRVRERIDTKGVVTSLKEEHENSASRIFSNDRDCLAPHVHSRRAKGSVRPCRSEMTLDVESVVGGCVS